MDNEAQMILEDTISFCERDGLDARLINMLRQCEPISLTDDALAIEAPSRFAYSYLMKHRETLERYLEEIAFMPLSLSVTVPLPAQPGAPGVSRETAPAPARRPAQAAAPQMTTPQMTAAPATAPFGQTAPSPAPTPFASTAGRPFPTAPATGTGEEHASGAAQAAPEAPEFKIPPVEFPAAGEDEGNGRVTITNTISPDALARLMSTMSGSRPVQTHQHAVAAPITAPVEEDKSSGSSKFTFENFVCGNENKHAYSSALRFAAMADEPGTYTSLFIYGKSGLGKTHLLLAIKNLLAQEKPYLRVKYANSQAYIDDYITGLQEGKVAAAMRDYHNADILIIDDIQNIIGKTQSIENFFQLMDEFIRNNKKVAIASDRAPKNLGMDERLTSRFNAGMLCLVSEPSYEMKLTILRRYYEHTILPAAAGEAPQLASNSLLTQVRSGAGRLNDEQMNHMAQVSGTNIRELESFCERCAGESFELEQEGRELTGDDIDRIANEYFDSAHKKIHVETVQKVVEDFYHVSHADLIGPRRTAAIKNARHVAVYLALDMCEMTNSAVGAAFGGRDHSTVINSIKWVENKKKEDRSFVDDLQQLRNKITLRS